MIKFCYDCAEKWYRGYLHYEHPWDKDEKAKVLVPTKQCLECKELHVKNLMYWAHAQFI